MSWLSLALVLLRIADNIVGYVKTQQGIQAGQDEEIAKASAAILLKTQSAKAVLAEVTSMTDAQVDATLKGLEP